MAPCGQRVLLSKIALQERGGLLRNSVTKSERIMSLIGLIQAARAGWQTAVTPGALSRWTFRTLAKATASDFLSLVSVSMFGIFCANDDTHKHFMYSKRTGGKGVDEVSSMLHHMLHMLSVFEPSHQDPDTELSPTQQSTSDSEPKSTQLPDSEPPPTQWPESLPPPTQTQDTQLPLAQLSESVFTLWPSSASTSNDRPGNALSSTPRSIIGQSSTLDKASSTISIVNHSGHSRSFFSSYYKKLQGIQKHQMFRMVHDRPGQAEYPRTPSSEGTWTTLRRNTPTTPLGQFADAMAAVPKLRKPPLNPDKVADFFKKILPFVPAEFSNDPVYQKPSKFMEE